MEGEMLLRASDIVISLADASLGKVSKGASDSGNPFVVAGCARPFHGDAPIFKVPMGPNRGRAMVRSALVAITVHAFLCAMEINLDIRRNMLFDLISVRLSRLPTPHDS